MNPIRIPENTGLGISLLPKSSNIKSEYIKHIITNKNKYDFSYEFRYDKENIPVFITGHELEKELPLVRFPLVVNTNNVNYIISNLIGSIKSTLTDGSLLNNKKSDYADFETLRNILVYQTISGKDISYLITLTAQLATTIITRAITQHLRLDTFDTVDVEGAVFYYLLTRYGEFSNDSIKTKMLNLLSLGYRNNINACDLTIGRLENIDKNSPIGTFINANTTNNTLKALESKSILSMLSNLWFSGSENSSMHMYMAVEDFSTMASILYHTLNTQTGKKTILFRVLNDAKRSLRLDQFNSSVDGILRDNKIQ